VNKSRQGLPESAESTSWYWSTCVQLERVLKRMAISFVLGSGADLRTRSDGPFSPFFEWRSIASTVDLKSVSVLLTVRDGCITATAK
jgi:hypothetical protein